MEERILFVDCAGSKLVPQINNFYKENYLNSGAFSANLRMMGSIYPFLIKICYYKTLITARYDRDFETFKDQAIQLITGQELNRIVVVSEPDCLRYRQLLENDMIVNYDSQEEAFRKALECFKVFLKKYANIPYDRLTAWYIHPYDNPGNILFREIPVLE